MNAPNSAQKSNEVLMTYNFRGFRHYRWAFCSRQTTTNDNLYNYYLKSERILGIFMKECELNCTKKQIPIHKEFPAAKMTELFTFSRKFFRYGFMQTLAFLIKV